MPRKKISHNRTDVRAQWELMEKMGLEPVSVKFHPDGTFRIMTRKHAEINKPDNTPVATTGEADWWEKKVFGDGSA